MDHSGTVVIVARPGSDWTDSLEVLSERYAYRVLPVASPAEALTTMSSIHVDLAVAEDRQDETVGLDFLTRLRVSHPDIMRVYVTPAPSSLSYQALSKAAIYQFLLTPLDPAQLGLAVERALEARELHRRHRI
ncbi:MAG: sigma-54-dependent Fis family transcriptional regulator, partial [Mesorhizobium sp.]